MNPIEIEIKEPAGMGRNREFLCFGVPLPRGKIQNTEQLGLFCDDGSEIYGYLSATARWPDNSIKWLLVETQISVSAHSSTIIHLKATDKLSSELERGLKVTQEKNSITVDTGEVIFELDSSHTGLLGKISDKSTGNRAAIESSLELTEAAGNLCGTKITSMELTDSDNPIRQQIVAIGEIQVNAGRVMRFRLSIDFCLNSAETRWQVQLHNPAAALHPGGFWDLGDKNSLLFNDFSIRLNFEPTVECSYQLEPGSDITSAPAENLEIYQDSSGGEHWNSINHINRNREIKQSFQGYRVYQSDSVIAESRRADPIVVIGSNQLNLGIYFDEFWQNCPSGLKIEEGNLCVNMFPNRFADQHELQPGEKKTHTFRLAFNTEIKRLQTHRKPLQVTLPFNVYLDAGIVSNPEGYQPESQIQNIIDQGLKGKDSFFQKRESIDEYGWRHYGDVYADHETLYTKDKKNFTSHYNNQYDLIYGFLYQFIISGDHHWHELADALSRHICDIDIYDTDDDRLEYNHGMFWHTDHYLSAGTCSHRTFSLKHLEENPPFTHGGGPGSEHCYTGGLLLYYYMTRSCTARDALLETERWITTVCEGTGTVLEFLYNFLRKDLKKYVHLMQGKCVSAYRFPLTRGTANYVNTLLDVYDLTSDDN
ncbi:MAG: hypothetical protein MI673_03855, partial [Thiotrichales bacterium]|nr:hypothetical protein [Thiotrichales bacterium]